MHKSGERQLRSHTGRVRRLQTTGSNWNSQLRCLRDRTTLLLRSGGRVGLGVQGCPQHNLLRLLGRRVPKGRVREWHLHSM